MTGFDSTGRGMDRRGFLSLAAKTAVGLSVFSRMPEAFAGGSAVASGKLRSIIVLYMAGGASQFETFDPKPGKATGGQFRGIKTSIPGVQFSELLPGLAKEAKDLSVLRAMSTKEGNHRRAAYLMRTGYSPAGPVQHPSLGALIARYRGKADFPLPSFVSINGASVGGGFLGVEYSPFVVQNPGKPVANLKKPGSVDRGRFKRRWKLLEAVEKRFAEGRRDDLVEGHRKVYEQAERFMHSKQAVAFDIQQEPDKLRAAYGQNAFGQGCLMARRLVETGVPFVEVTLGGWDTHRDNFNKTKELCGRLDPGFSTLVRDLRDRKLLDSTLIVWTGDFGRTPRINGNDGRDHFPRAWTTLLAGGGVGKGVVVGQTGPSGGDPKGRVVKAADLFTTIGQLAGLDGSVENISKAGRPIRVLDKDGSPIKEIL